MSDAMSNPKRTSTRYTTGYGDSVTRSEVVHRTDANHDTWGKALTGSGLTWEPTFGNKGLGTVRHSNFRVGTKISRGGVIGPKSIVGSQAADEYYAAARARDRAARPARPVNTNRASSTWGAGKKKIGTKKGLQSK